MVNDLLDLAKVEAGKTEIRLGKVDLSQFLGQVIRALMRPLATKDGVTLVFEDAPAGVSLVTDEARAGQILRNLISNALKFTESGEVRVAAELTPAGDSLRVSVSDTGIGIPPQELDRIFQEFTQVENRLQRQVKGTGLGLPLSRKLATLLGGSLEVASQPGAGSTFTLTLPIHHPAAEGDDASGEERRTAILIIDDDETSRYIARQLFRDTKFRILEAASGDEGAELARFEKPALILLDLMMPGRSRL